jgi:dihydrofolate reductase
MQMRKLVAALFMTLDAVVEKPSSWLQFSDEMGEMIGAGITQADAILLGRRTYLEFAELWPKQGNDSPFAAFINNTPKYIASSTLRDLDWANSTLVSGDIAGFVSDLKRQPGKNIQVPGSPRLVRSLLRDGLLDELSLTLSPVVLGSGLRLFDEMAGRVDLTLVGSRVFSNGVVSVTYQPAAA